MYEEIFELLASKLSECDRELIRLYALLACVRGENTTLEDVHDAWALWRIQSRPDHPSAIPFDQLSVEVQEYDRPYAEAIYEVS